MRVPLPTLARTEVIEHLRHFAPIVVRARHLLAAHLDAARVPKLLNLCIDRLAVGANACMAGAAVEAVPVISYGKRNP
jgi:hypothetical protein